jgi:hypothetical protein
MGSGRYPRIVRVQINRAPLNQPVAGLEHIARSAYTPIRIAGAPWPIHTFAVAGPLAHDRVTAGEYPVQTGIAMSD